MEPETRFQALRGAAGANKSWARPVPAAAVTPAALVVAVFIGPKAFVAGLISHW